MTSEELDEIYDTKNAHAIEKNRLIETMVHLSEGYMTFQPRVPFLVGAILKKKESTIVMTFRQWFFRYT